MSYSAYQKSLQEKNYFEAYLKDENNKLLEIGWGNVSLEHQAVDFMNDFVPLLELNAKATIVHLIDGEECHSYTGSVYLSSKTRLQLSNLTDRLITYKEMYLPQKVLLTGSVYSSSMGISLKKNADIEVFSISIREICFTVSKQFQHGTRLLLSMDDPVRMKDVVLEVYRQLQFSNEKTVCYATIEHCPAGCRKALIDFLASNLILFP